jgi:hypothetical protein
MAETVVHFDKELRHLDPADAEAWRLWLVEQQLDHVSIACPSELIYREPTARKMASVTVELLTRDPRGALRGKKKIYFSASVLPFPPGYRVEEFTSSNNRTLPLDLERDAEMKSSVAVYANSGSVGDG